MVAYPAGGTAEIVRNGETGLLARPDDVADLSACIGRVLTHPGLRSQLVCAARAQVVARFTLKRQADRQASPHSGGGAEWQAHKHWAGE